MTSRHRRLSIHSERRATSYGISSLANSAMNEDDEAWDTTITREDLNTPSNSSQNPSDLLHPVEPLFNPSPDEDVLDGGWLSSGSLDRNLPAAAPAQRAGARNSSLSSLLKSGIIPGCEGAADYFKPPSSDATMPMPMPSKNPNDPALPELDCPLVLNESGQSLREINILDVKSTLLAQSTKKERKEEANRDVTAGPNSALLSVRRLYLTTLSQALLVFAAPSDRIIFLLEQAANVLEVKADFQHIPGFVWISYEQGSMKVGRTETISGSGQLELGRLKEIESVVNMVSQSKIPVREGTDFLRAMINSEYIFSVKCRILVAFILSALICPLAFGGSFTDLWVAGALGALLAFVQVISEASQSVSSLVSLITVMVLSFIARALASLESGLFCYTATASSAVISLLQGYIILTSTTAIISGSMISGSLKIVYALLFTLFLGFSLQNGSDLYLLFDSKAFNAAASAVTDDTILQGTFTVDDGTQTMLPLLSSFSYTKSSTLQHQVLSCYRPPDAPWYLQTFPWWTDLFIVPIFAFVCSLDNSQPASCRSAREDLAVMTIIGCISYAANELLVRMYAEYSVFMATVGAFCVAWLGHGWARLTGRSAFNAMVTGVLFLVPNGLSENGGITTNGNGVVIGKNLLAVSISIGVGLFMGQLFSFVFPKKHIRNHFAF